MASFLSSTKIESTNSNNSYSLFLISFLYFCLSLRNLLLSTTYLLSSSVTIPKAFNVAEAIAAPALSDTSYRTETIASSFNVTQFCCKIDFGEQGNAESNNTDISEFSLVLESDAKPSTISIFAKLVETVLLELDCF